MQCSAVQVWNIIGIHGNDGMCVIVAVLFDGSDSSTRQAGVSQPLRLPKYDQIDLMNSRYIAA